MKKAVLAVVVGGFLMAGLGVFSPSEASAIEFSISGSRGSVSVNTNRRSFNNSRPGISQPGSGYRQFRQPSYPRQWTSPQPGYRPVYRQPAYPVRTHGQYHDTSHFDYHPPAVVPHGDHFHVTPGRYQFHQTGHYHP